MVENAKFTTILRGENSGIDKYYFGAENIIFSLFVIIGIVCAYIPITSETLAFCAGVNGRISFLSFRINALNESAEFLGCRFAIVSTASFAVHAFLLIYFFVIFLKFMTGMARMSLTKLSASAVVTSILFLFIVYFLYVMDISIRDPRFPGGMGLMNSRFILFLSAGANLVIAVALANFVALLVRLWRQRGENRKAE